MLSLNSNKAVRIKYQYFLRPLKIYVVVCVCDLHPTENTLIQLPFVCMNTLVIFLLLSTHRYTHANYPHAHIHHSKILNPDTSSGESVEFI